MIVSRLLFSTFLILVSGNVLAQPDTVWIEYKDVPDNTYTNYGKHRDDPHEQDFYPFNGMNIYTINKVNEVNEVRPLYFIFASHGPEGTKSPFHYILICKDDLSKYEFYTQKWIDKTSYLDLIRFFRDENKVIMLYDTTQPPGAEQYLVRVYFDFDAWE